MSEKYPFPLFRHYLEDEDDKPYYHLNSIAYYYEDMARKEQLVKDMAKHIAGYDKNLQENLTVIEQQVGERLSAFDTKVEELPATVSELLDSWVDDGSIKTIIDTVIIDEKIAPITVKLAETVKIQSQADFVNIVQNLTNYTSMIFKKIDATNFSVFVHNGFKHVTYNFTKDVNDDMYKIGEVFAGFVAPEIYDMSAATLIGTGWAGVGYESQYTTVVGDKFKASVKGDSITFRGYTDTRGGIWRFIIDGNTVNPITISTYSTTVGSKNFTVLSGLNPNIEHTVEAEFLGADPNNAPTATARGWIFVPTASNSATILGYVDGNPSSTVLMPKSSNKEYAFNLTSGSNTGWIPEHDFGSAFAASPIKILVDAIEINLSAMAAKDIIKCKDFRMVQNLYARFPQVSADNLGQIYLTTFLDLNGIISVSGKWNTLKAVKIGIGYPLMMPVMGNILNECVTSFGNSKVNAANDTDYYFAEEKDNAYSAAMVSATNRQFAVVGSIEFPYKTLGKGFTKPNLHQASRFWQRTTQPKFYFTNFQNRDLAIGDSFGWNVRLAVAEIENIYDYIKS